VRSVQGKIRFQAVIEAPQIPSVRVVTALARTSKTLPVGVVGLVAAGANDLRVFESRSCVALLARDHGVQAEQWEARQVVLEEDIASPAEFAVTVAAIRALLPAVDVIVHMATRATIIDLGIF
jgi:hypothetical protein